MQAVVAVEQALAQNQPFAVVFMDMLMPPGKKDGVWAAARIRELDPAVEIVICTAYFGPSTRAKSVVSCRPRKKLSYLQKPFHSHEVRQTTIALASKWRAERRIVRLAYFDTLTGLPNREQSNSRLVSAIVSAKERKAHPWLYSIWIWTTSSGVNDTLGHAAGDELLCVVATRLRKRAAPQRYGGARSHWVTRAPAISLVWAATSLWPSCRIYGTPMTQEIVAARLIGALREPRATWRRRVSSSLPAWEIAVFPPRRPPTQSLCFVMPTSPCTLPNASVPGRSHSSMVR